MFFDFLLGFEKRFLESNHIRIFGGVCVLILIVESVNFNTNDETGVRGVGKNPDVGGDANRGRKRVDVNRERFGELVDILVGGDDFRGGFVD